MTQEEFDKKLESQGAEWVDTFKVSFLPLDHIKGERIIIVNIDDSLYVVMKNIWRRMGLSDAHVCYAKHLGHIGDSHHFVLPTRAYRNIQFKLRADAHAVRSKFLVVSLEGVRELNREVQQRKFESGWVRTTKKMPRDWIAIDAFCTWFEMALDCISTTPMDQLGEVLDIPPLTACAGTKAPAKAMELRHFVPTKLDAADTEDATTMKLLLLADRAMQGYTNKEGATHGGTDAWRDRIAWYKKGVRRQVPDKWRHYEAEVASDYQDYLEYRKAQQIVAAYEQKVGASCK